MGTEQKSELSLKAKIEKFRTFFSLTILTLLLAGCASQDEISSSGDNSVEPTRSSIPTPIAASPTEIGNIIQNIESKLPTSVEDLIELLKSNDILIDQETGITLIGDMLAKIDPKDLDNPTFDMNISGYKIENLTVVNKDDGGEVISSGIVYSIPKKWIESLNLLTAEEIENTENFVIAIYPDGKFQIIKAKSIVESTSDSVADSEVIYEGEFSEDEKILNQLIIIEENLDQKADTTGISRARMKMIPLDWVKSSNDIMVSPNFISLQDKISESENLTLRPNTSTEDGIESFIIEKSTSGPVETVKLITVSPNGIVAYWRGSEGVEVTLNVEGDALTIELPNNGGMLTYDYESGKWISIPNNLPDNLPEGYILINPNEDLNNLIGATITDNAENPLFAYFQRYDAEEGEWIKDFKRCKIEDFRNCVVTEEDLRNGKYFAWLELLAQEIEKTIVWENDEYTTTEWMFAGESLVPLNNGSEQISPSLELRDQQAFGLFEEIADDGTKNIYKLEPLFVKDPINKKVYPWQIMEALRNSAGEITDDGAMNEGFKRLAVTPVKINSEIPFGLPGDMAAFVQEAFDKHPNMKEEVLDMCIHDPVNCAQRLSNLRYFFLADNANYKYFKNPEP